MDGLISVTCPLLHVMYFIKEHQKSESLKELRRWDSPELRVSDKQYFDASWPHFILMIQSRQFSITKLVISKMMSLLMILKHNQQHPYVLYILLKNENICCIICIILALCYMHAVSSECSQRKKAFCLSQKRDYIMLTVYQPEGQ